MTIRAWIASVLAVLICWAGLMMLVMVESDAAPGAMVLFPPRDFVARLPKDTAVVGMGSYWITVWSGSPHLGTSLYAAGAWIVLPAGLRGCVQITNSARFNGPRIATSGPLSD